jgi:hypothetical protein
MSALAVSLGLNVVLLCRTSERKSGSAMPGGGPTDSKQEARDDRGIASEQVVIGRPWRDILKKRSLMIAWETWVSRAPQEAVEYVNRSAEGVEREEQIASAIGIWARTQPEQAAAWLDREAPHLKTDLVVDELIREWAVSQPAAAAEWADAIENSSLRTATVETLCAIWAERDGAAALGWLRNSKSGESGGIALYLTLEGWAENDPNGLRDALGTLGGNDVETEAAKVYGAALAGSNPQDAWRFAAELKDEPMRLEAALAVMEAWADLAPSEAAKVLDPAKYPELLVDATRSLASKWIVSDRELAMQWLDKLSPGPQADAAFESASEQLSSGNPREAITLALRISEPNLRLEAVMSSYAELVDQDPSAKEWIRSQALPEDVRRRLGSSVH